RPEIRAYFGRGLRVPGLAFVVPGSLVLVNGGLVTLVLAGVLDDVWHNVFGLDETDWSLPHAMLVKAWLIVCLGCMSSRMALRVAPPMAWYTRIFFGCVLLALSYSAF